MKNQKGQMGKKGQMFLIGAVVIVASLVIIKFNMASPAAKKERESLEVRFEHDIFENIANEFNSTLRFSNYEPENITTNVFDFANFTERKMMGHSMDFTFLYVGALCNRTTNKIDISLVNMLGSTIDANVSLDDGQSNATSNIVNYERWDSNFTITPGTEYKLNLTYNSTAGDATTRTIESITVKTKKNKDIYVGFFYVSLESEDATHTGKYQKKININ